MRKFKIATKFYDDTSRTSIFSILPSIKKEDEIDGNVQIFDISDVHQLIEEHIKLVKRGYHSELDIWYVDINISMTIGQISEYEMKLPFDILYNHNPKLSLDENIYNITKMLDSIDEALGDIYASCSVL